MYKISNHTRRQARRYNVTVKRSKRTGRKIDVFRKGKMIASGLGAIGYTDYGTLLSKGMKEEANQRRRAYRARHAKALKKRGSRGWYSYHLLW